MKKILFALGLLCLPLLVSAQDLRESVCVVRGEYTAEEKAVLEDFAMWLSRANFLSDSRVLSVYKNGTFGSGAVVETGGKRYVLTNRHVVGYAKEMTVEFLFRTDTVKLEHCPLVSVSQESDLALIALPDWCVQPSIPLAEGEIEDADDIVAAGFPGLDKKPSWQLTKGSVSNAYLTIEEVKHSLIQHTASIDPGSSGGPLLRKTDAGYVLAGVNTMKAADRENVGIAIPAAVVRSFLAGIDAPQHPDQDFLSELSIDGKAWGDMLNSLSRECYDSLRSIKREMPLDIVKLTLSFECDAKEAKKAKKEQQKEERVITPITADRDRLGSIRLEYTNYLSLNQSVELVFERIYRKYIITGVQLGAQFDSYYRQEADSVPDTAAGLMFGLRAGVRVPIDVDKYQIVPRFVIAPTGDVLSNFSNVRQRVSFPISLGIDFAMPVAGNTINVGLHYTYDLGIYGSSSLLTSDNSNLHRKLLSSGGVRNLYGQSGLGMSVSFCW